MKQYQFFKLFTALLLGVLKTSIPAGAQVSEISKLQRALVHPADSTQYVDILNRIGFLMHMKSADSCLLYGMKAKSVSQRLHYSKGKAEALSNIATSLFLKGLYSQSLGVFSEALLLYQQIHDRQGSVNMLMNLAVVYDVLGDRKNVNRFTAQSVDVAAQIPGDSVLSMYYANYVYLRPGLSRDSIEYLLNKGENIAVKFHDDRSSMMIWQLRSQKLLESNQPRPARQLIDKSIDIARKNHWDYHQITGLQYLADYFRSQKKIDSALFCYDAMYSLADRNGFNTFQTEILKGQKQLLVLQNNRGELEKVNERLVLALQRELDQGQFFWSDYVAYANQEQRLHQMQIENENDSKTFNLMLAIFFITLAAGIYIAMLYRKLLRSSQSQQQLSSQIQIKNMHLQKEDEFKASLVSMIAHDFRSPLATTLSLLSLLKENEFDKQDLSEFYFSIEDQIKNTLGVFDNILNWIKIQYAGYEYKPEKLPIGELLDAVLTLYNKMIAERNITVLNLVPKHHLIQSDQEIIQFVNRNLIQNALKFSPAGGVITLQLYGEAGQDIICISDQGEGMSQQQRDNLFSVSRGTVSEKSAGVALKICSELITRVNGRLWSESNDGKGTRFLYSIPVDSPQQPPKQS